MSAGRLPLTIVAVALLAAALSGCTLQLEPPKLEVITQPAYPSHNVLIPYELRGDGTYAQARWTLKRYRTDIGEWELVQSWEISVPNGSSGILQLERFNMYDARYEITVELLTSRGELSTAAPTLTSQAEFYVDTQAPGGSIVLNDSQGGSPYLPEDQLKIYPEYDEMPDLNIESPVMLYHRIDSTVPPTNDQDPTGDTIIMWEGGEPFYSRVLTIIAIDQAGNIGEYRAVTYTAQ